MLALFLLNASCRGIFSSLDEESEDDCISSLDTEYSQDQNHEMVWMDGRDSKQM